MKIAPVLRLLQERVGLDPASLESAGVRGAVAARLRACGLHGAREYAERLAADPAELQALLDDVVVPETWFFRGGDLFAYLAGVVRDARRTPFRVLSLPCSSGEEPYSLAIALVEAGLPLGSCALNGVDVSPRNVAQARRGVFPGLSFRQTDPDLRDRHFRPVADGWQIDERLRAAVRFSVGNLLDPALLLFEPPYDLVFCRNLFIYLTPEARAQGVEALARLVALGGLLCMGHAEPLDRAEGRFKRTGPEGYFLYRRSPHLPLLPRPAAVREEKARVGRAGGLPPPSPRHPPRESERPRQTGRSAATPRGPAESLPAQLEAARRHADAGQLGAALDLCLSLRRRYGPSADLYSLLGIIHQARRDRGEAAEAFRKALYLQPDHREALTHLMLLCRQQGDDAQAARLRQRLERLGDETGGEP